MTVRVLTFVFAALFALSSSVAISLAADADTALLSRVQQRREERLRRIQIHPAATILQRVEARLQRRKSYAKEKTNAEETERTKRKIQVIEGVNMERALMGIASLSYHRDLETSAQLHAEDMLNRGYFDHETPEGLNSSDRIKATGYTDVNAQECRCTITVALGENIAKGQQTVKQVVAEWMASPSHRKAMLSKEYSEIGVGITGDIWVLNFGSVEIEPVGR